MVSPIHFLVVGLNHRTAPVEFREKFAVSETKMTQTLNQMVGDGVIREVMLLSTCNRVEIYVVGPDPMAMEERVRHFLSQYSGMDCSKRTEFFVHGFPRVVQHVFEVASALDSMVVGETEILGQVKEAYRMALESYRTGLGLNKLFQTAFSVSKEIRSRTRIGQGSVSVGSVAVDLAVQIFGDLKDRSVLLLGAGEMGETTARFLTSRGAKHLKVSNRSPERAITLAQSLGGVAIPWEKWNEACQSVDIVISSTSAPQAIITRPVLSHVIDQRRGIPLFLIDIAVPRNIEREVTEMEGVYLYDVDDLQLIADQNRALREQELAVCRQIIRERVDEFSSWVVKNSTQIAKCPTARKLFGNSRNPS